MKTCLVMGAATLMLAAAAAQAGGPYYHGGYGGWGGGYSACEACGSTWGCCDHPYSKHDHLWDNYCQEKWCPQVHYSRLQPWWHGAPYSSCPPTAACTGPSCASGLGSSGGAVSYAAAGSASPVTPAPSGVAVPQGVPNAAPSVPHPTPSAPMPPKSPDTLELKLLSRPRTAPQP